MLTDGIIVLDKPTGISSNRALQQVKKIMHLKKAGHTGSLDPLASGVLPICFGKATRLSQFLLNAEKSYLVTAKFGIATDTGDAEGKIISEVDQAKVLSKLTTTNLEQLFRQFLGEINQVPPMFSALKRNGVPLYKLARQGKTVDLTSRKVVIKQLELLNIDQDQVTFNVMCSKGTYIRSLVIDFGKTLQCGAHVTALRRTQAGPYNLSQTVTLDQINQTYLLSMSSVFAAWPRIYLSITEENIFLHGKQEIIPSIRQFMVRNNQTEVWACLVRESSKSLSVFTALGLVKLQANGQILARILL